MHKYEGSHNREQRIFTAGIRHVPGGNTIYYGFAIFFVVKNVKYRKP